jgi:lipooligosaccharide transport system ATP-binding protein
MKRRLTLARALVHDPDILFLDEPTTGLDPQARHLIWQGLRRLIAAGKTIVLTTHFMEEAERLCDRLAIVDRGRIITTGSPQALIASQIEAQVVEVSGDGATDWARGRAGVLAARTELVGETAFLYCSEGDAEAARLAAESGFRVLRRPANLEDVFLKLTGRELRD